MNETDRDAAFNLLIAMSDRQVDPIVKRRLTAMLGRPNAEIKNRLLGLMDDVAFGELTSNFELRVLDFIWRNACGGTHTELTTRDVSDTPENREGYGWELRREVTDEG